MTHTRRNVNRESSTEWLLTGWRSLELRGVLGLWRVESVEPVWILAISLASSLANRSVRDDPKIFSLISVKFSQNTVKLLITRKFNEIQWNSMGLIGIRWDSSGYFRILRSSHSIWNQQNRWSGDYPGGWWSIIGDRERITNLAAGCSFDPLLTRVVFTCLQIERFESFAGGDCTEEHSALGIQYELFAHSKLHWCLVIQKVWTLIPKTERRSPFTRNWDCESSVCSLYCSLCTWVPLEGRIRVVKLHWPCTGSTRTAVAWDLLTADRTACKSPNLKFQIKF